MPTDKPSAKGFGERNLNTMLAFARAYPDPGAILQQPVAKSAPPEKVQQAVAKTGNGDSLLWRLPWGHHAVLLAKVKPLQARNPD